MKEYDPLIAPEPREWLALDEDERMILVEDYHRKIHFKAPSFQAHVTVHVIVENQLAEGFKDARKAMRRLLDEDLGRHDALHAIGSVLLEHVSNIIRQGSAGKDPNKAYRKALRSLTTEKWIEDFGPE